MEQNVAMRSIRSYVRREGRLTKAQARVLDEPNPYLVELSPKIQPQSLFSKDGTITLEIGFGNGDSLLQMAIEQPERLFIGIEVHRPGVGSLLLNCEKSELDNLRLFNADAHHVLNALEDHSLDCIQIFFPDPWHKKRHNKRRLINKTLLDLLAKKLKFGGICHIVTDWQAYAEVIAELLAEHSQFEPVMEALNASVIAQRPATKYERRGLRHGHDITEFVFAQRSGGGADGL